MRAIAIFLFTTLFFSCASNSPEQANTTIILNGESIKELEDLTLKRAQESLDEFWQYVEKYPKNSFLKIKLLTNNEEIWVAVRRKRKMAKFGYMRETTMMAL